MVNLVLNSLPMDCQTDFQMGSERFLVDFHVGSVGSTREFHMDFKGFPVAFIKIQIDSKGCHCILPYGFQRMMCFHLL